LFTAVFRGDAAAVQTLLANGADVNATMKNGATALTLASEEGHDGVSALLVKAGAKRP
jgi:ankyrin repeat protein